MANRMNADGPLSECRAMLVSGMPRCKPDDGIVDRFIGDFKTAFEEHLGQPDVVWAHDRDSVTALAHAVGATAEFLAIQDGGAPATRAHLCAAFKSLKGLCPARSRGKYCTGVDPLP